MPFFFFSPRAKFSLTLTNSFTSLDYQSKRVESCLGQTYVCHISPQKTVSVLYRSLWNLWDQDPSPPPQSKMVRPAMFSAGSFDFKWPHGIMMTHLRLQLLKKIGLAFRNVIGSCYSHVHLASYLSTRCTLLSERASESPVYNMAGGKNLVNISWQ